MSALKSIVKRGLRHAAGRMAPMTWRWRAAASLAVLTYHRVLPADSAVRKSEQPGMYVSPQTLDLHIAVLKRHFELVHLDDWLRSARDGASLPQRACAITFDDGWRDNFEFALPVLSNHGAPATIFLVSDYVGTEHSFWPNRLMALVNESFAAPGSVTFPEPLRAIAEPVLDEARRRGELQSGDRDQIVQRAKSFDERRIRDLIAAAEQHSDGRADHREMLSSEEVARMAATGLIRFGSHTATHFRLGGTVSPEDLEREIVFSRAQLQKMCRQSVDVFCYPNGDTSPAAIDLVRRHYLGAVTTRRGWHSVSGDPYLVRRMGVHEDISSDAESFLARVSAWM